MVNLSGSQQEVIGRPKNLITVDGKDFVVPLTMPGNQTPVPGQNAQSQSNQPQAIEQIQQKIANTPVDTARPIIGASPQPQDPNALNIPLVSEVGRSATEISIAAEQTNLFRKIKGGTASTDEIMQASGKFNLTPLDIEVIKAGEADISKTGAFIEGLPFVPREVKKFVSLFSAPSSKVDELKDNIAGAKESIVMWSDLAKANPAAASRYIGLIKDKEEQVLRMEARIKIILIQSPDLRANPEQVFAIQQDISKTLAEIQGKREELMLIGLR